MCCGLSRPAIKLGNYINALKSEVHHIKTLETVENNSIKNESSISPTIKHHHKESTNNKFHRIAKIGIIILLTSGVSSLGASLAIKISKKPVALSTTQTNQTRVLGTATEKVFPYTAAIKMPSSGYVPVRNSPAISSTEIKSIKTKETVFVFKKINGWSQIGLSKDDKDKSWWVNDQYIENTD